MGKGLVETTFEAGPDDTLAAVDVYDSGGGGSEVVNSYQKKDGGAIDVLTAVNGGGAGGGGSTAPAPGAGGGGGGSSASPALTKSQINKILSNGSSAIFGFLTDLSSLVGARFGVDTNNGNKIGTVINGVTKPLSTDYSASDIKNIAGIANILSGNKYNNTVTDKNALDALVLSTVVTGAEAGLPEIFSTIASNSTHDAEILAVAAKDAIELTIGNGSVDVLFDVAKTKYISQMGTRYPSLIDDLFFTIKKPDDLNEQDFNGFYSTLVDTLEKIRPNWDTTYRNNQPILFTDISIRNDFLNEMIQSYSLTATLEIKYNPDVNYNSAMDILFSSPEVSSYFIALYGAANTLDPNYVDEIISRWVEPTAMELRDKQKNAWGVVLANQFPNRTLEEDLRYHFPLEYPRLNESISLT